MNSRSTAKYYVNDHVVLCTNVHCKAMSYFSQSVSDFHYFIIVKRTSVDTTDTLCYRFTQDKTDQFDWVRNSLKTQSSQTGPSSDHTYGTDKGEILIEIYQKIDITFTVTLDVNMNLYSLYI